MPLNKRMNLSFRLFLTLVYLASSILADDYDKVRVEVYYEAKCSGCQEFITGSLSNTLAKSDMAEIIDLKMVPYGNTKYSGGVYSCQHGEEECMSDVYELCTLYKLSGNITSINSGDTSMTAFPYIQCMEEAEGDPVMAESCYSKTLAKTTSVSWDTITTCFSEEANSVQAQGAEATPAHDYVPWVLVDGVLLEHTDLLQQTVCKDYTGPQPSSCKRLLFQNSVCKNI